MKRLHSDNAVDVPNVAERDLIAMNADLKSNRQIRRSLENMHLSADAKAILDDLIGKTIWIGKQVIQVGRAILTFAIDLMKVSPTSVFGAVVGLIVSSLIASVPLLGATLGAVLAPLLLAFGIGMGAVSDAMNGNIRERLDEFLTRYRVLVA